VIGTVEAEGAFKHGLNAARSGYQRDNYESNELARFIVPRQLPVEFAPEDDEEVRGKGSRD
jgi:hypothetical protein